MRHAGIVVGNLEKSIAFYRSLGFKPVEIASERWDGHELHICKMGRTGGTMLELVEGAWKPHFAITVDGLDSHSWGYPIRDRPKARVCFIQDPDGNWIELVEEKNGKN